MACPPGYITRNAYVRKSKKGSVKVSRGCTPDKGKPGKTRQNQRVLPKPSKDRSLSKYGYNIHKNEQSRHKSLRDASDVYGELAVLRRLNLIRNYQSEKNNKQKMSTDVEYVSKKYKQSKGSKKSKRGTRRTKKSKRSMQRTKNSKKNSKGSKRKSKRNTKKSKRSNR